MRIRGKSEPWPDGRRSADSVSVRWDRTLPREKQLETSSLCAMGTATWLEASSVLGGVALPNGTRRFGSGTSCARRRFAGKRRVGKRRSGKRSAVGRGPVPRRRATSLNGILGERACAFGAAKLRKRLDERDNARGAQPRACSGQVSGASALDARGRAAPNEPPAASRTTARVAAARTCAALAGRKS